MTAGEVTWQSPWMTIAFAVTNVARLTIVTDCSKKLIVAARLRRCDLRSKRAVPLNEKRDKWRAGGRPGPGQSSAISILQHMPQQCQTPKEQSRSKPSRLSSHPLPSFFCSSGPYDAPDKARGDQQHDRQARDAKHQVDGGHHIQVQKVIGMLRNEMERMEILYGGCGTMGCLIKYKVPFVALHLHQVDVQPA